MTHEWFFKPRRAGDTCRDPISQDLFSQEAIEDSAEALVRESIQNSLDAALDGKRVTVRIAHGVARQPRQLAPYLTGLWPHLRAEHNGLQLSIEPETDCEFLTIEDFGTRGLEGDPAQWEPDPDAKNDFFAFFRAEGYTDKEGNKLGRWGVGKTVFPRSSVVNTFFGLTVRHSDKRRLLLGRAILKSHRVGDIGCVPDGYFGRVEDEFVHPLEDAHLLERFRDLFDLRRVSEPGLSVVVPWQDSGIDTQSLLQAVIRNYFYAVLSGRLEVRLESSSTVVSIRADTIAEHLAQTSASFRLTAQPLLELAAWSLQPKQHPPAITIGQPSTDYSPKWSEELVAEEQAKELRSTLAAGLPAAVRVPIRVMPSGHSGEDGAFSVFLKRDEHCERPVFVREGIVVTNAQGRSTRGFCSLVHVESGPLARLLGDAENIAHTEWSQTISSFRRKYRYGPAYLRFVKESVASLVRLLYKDQSEADPQLLLDYFGLAVDSAEDVPDDVMPERGSSRGTRRELPPVFPAPSPPRYRVSRVEGGFSIGRGHPDAEVPDTLAVAVAYDVRRGSALAKYYRDDFRLDDSERTVDLRNAEVIEIGGNHVRVRIMAPDFHVGITGFDANRDLYVRVDAESKEESIDRPQD